MKTSLARLITALFFLLILSVIPLPDLLREIRIPFVLLFILYIQYFLPNYFHLFLVFFVGLWLDGLSHTIFGQHAAALLISCWFATYRSSRFGFFNLGHQMLLIGCCVLLYELTFYVTDFLLGHQTSFLTRLILVAISILIWPWYKLFCDLMLLKKSKLSTRI